MLPTIIGFALALGFGCAIVLSLRPWLRSWGATPAELARPLPGGEELAGRKVVSTLAVTVDAPPAEVWPWLVQLGVGRGGFYSYAWLENLLGCGVVNVDRIVPELQSLARGDPVVLHPNAPPLRVTVCDPPRALALEGWTFVLEPAGAGTRLISRTYEFPVRPHRSFGERAMDAFFRSVWGDLAHFIMQRKQLLEIKRLAERAHTAQPDGTAGDAASVTSG